MYYLKLAFILFIYMNGWFLVSLIKKRNDVADIAWGLGFVLLSWLSYVFVGNSGVRGLLVNALVSLWGIRLAWHIHSRNKGKTEDYRYLAWRHDWGTWFYVRSYVQIYLLQGFLLFLVALPILLIQEKNETPIGWLDFIGIGIWIIGMFFEVVGDAQLAEFKNNPTNKGRFMQSGLWAYTRHPNYFGEVTLWWGIGLMSLSVPYGWMGLIGPLTISFLILKVSGIPMLEKKKMKHPEFAQYKRRVSAFFPLRPRTEAGK